MGTNCEARGRKVGWLIWVGLAGLLLVPLGTSPAQNAERSRPPERPVGLEPGGPPPGRPPAIEVLPLTVLDAARVAETLRAVFGDPRGGGPIIEPYAPRNVLIVRGTREQIDEIRSLLLPLGEGEAPANMRSLTLEGGSAAVMAEALQKLLPQMRANPVKVIVPTQPGPGGSAAGAPKSAGPAPKDAKPGKADAPITLTATGNRLIVTSDDPQALAMVVELFRLLQAPAGEGDFEVVRLKNARAVDAARVLDEAYNGARAAAGGFPGRGGQAGARPERIRVIADPATNSLLIKASPLDTLSIRKLLSQALDIPGAEEGPGPAKPTPRAEGP